MLKCQSGYTKNPIKQRNLHLDFIRRIASSGESINKLCIHSYFVSKILKRCSYNFYAEQQLHNIFKYKITLFNNIFHFVNNRFQINFEDNCSFVEIKNISITLSFRNKKYFN